MDDYVHHVGTRGSNSSKVKSSCHPSARGGREAMSLTQSLANVQVMGGNITVVGGNQHQHHYHQHNHALLQTTNNELLGILAQVSNHRAIHLANFSRATLGTGPQFTEWAEFCEWTSLEGGLKTMWGSGMPGAGKTVFASIVINEVEARAKASESPICVGYIYFRYSDHTTATLCDFITVLVKQTVERHPKCLSILSQVYERHIRENTQPSEGELLYLLRRFSEGMLATFYFLDALDEAPPDVQLDLLRKLSTLNVKIFITSRHLSTLEAHLPGAHHFPIVAQDRDLDLHIAKEISRSPALQTILNQDHELRDQIASMVKQKSGGMFLHASLHLDALRDCTSAYDVGKTLKDFPPQIEDVYQRTWNRILNQTASRKILAKNVLTWVLCATRSLKIEELRCAVATSPETHNFDSSRLVDEATLMGLCCGLLKVEEWTNVVRFVHYTAKDVVRRLISETSPYPHSLPAAVCMAHLTQSGFQRATFKNANALANALITDRLLAYAYDAWSIHARESLDDRPTAQRLAHFIQGCNTFPVEFAAFPHEFSTLKSLHTAAYFSLPISLAGSANLQEPNQQASGRGTLATPLIIAIRRNSLRAVEELLDLPLIHVNAADGNGYTPLMWALKLPQRGSVNINETILGLLLSHPDVNVNGLGGDGRSALMKASILDAEEAAKFLLAHPDIKPNQVNSAGETALMFAVFHESLRLVRVLLADPRVKVKRKSNAGETALYLAQRAARNRIQMSQKEGYSDVVELLRAHSDRKPNHLSQPLMDLLRRALPFSQKKQSG
ncbi:hypothetical protein BKA70DRAFT_1574786 [Coprinopsis sp. MPI-PUGE-AT-0042]|nr:hypothetical protein BKA70DRAFT_1574786 [Coprinopsis sp. MPI-PUGE-AT-0042]